MGPENNKVVSFFFLFFAGTDTGSEPSPAEGASLPTTPQRIFHLPPSIQFITIPETTGYKVVQTLRLSPPVIGLPLPNSAASPTYIFGE